MQRDNGEVFDAYQPSRYGYVTGRMPLVLSDALQLRRPLRATINAARKACSPLRTRLRSLFSQSLENPT